jgi:predicted HTH transcriptional regulator
LIKNNPEITTADLSDKLNIPFRTVQRHIEKLKKENKLLRKDGRKNGSWVVIE